LYLDSFLKILYTALRTHSRLRQDRKTQTC